MQNKTINARKNIYVIVKQEGDKINYLCNSSHSDVLQISDDTDDMDSIHEDIIVWTSEMDLSVYMAEILDEALAKVMYLSGFEEYCELVTANQIYIMELHPVYEHKVNFFASEMVDYWKE